MGLRNRVVVSVTAVVCVIGLAVVVAGGYLVSTTLQKREVLDVQDTLSQASAALAIPTEQLAKTAKDWASWDDTYHFIKTNDPDYVQSNLNGTALSSLRVDFMVLTEPSGKVVRAIAVDPGTATEKSLPKGLQDYLKTRPSILDTVASREGTSGVLSLPEGPVFLSAQPILRSDGTGPAAGMFLVGSFVEEPEMNALRLVVGRRMELFELGEGTEMSPWKGLLTGKRMVVAPVNSNTVDGYTLIKSVDGRQALVLRITQARTGLQLARDAGNAVMLAFIGFALLLIATLYISINRIVLKRLARLSSNVQSIARRGGEFDARLDATGSDEITALATDINSMLGALQASHSELRYLAGHDVLTGLDNRHQFERDLTREIAESRRLVSPGAVVWLDLDHFKNVNDTLGHLAGDTLLRDIAKTLRSELRDYSTIARLGGDEFAVILPHTTESAALSAANRLVHSIRDRSNSIAGSNVRLAVSIGVALFPEHGESTDTLLVSADLAMYHAKNIGGSRACVFSPEWHDELTDRMKWAERIADALAKDRFVLHAQPTVRLDDGRHGVYELLLRMVGEDGDLIAPGDFIPVAEHVGLMSQVDVWVVRATVKLLRQEAEAGRDTCFAMNVSASGLMDPRVLEAIEQALAETGVDPSRLVIEITETAAIADIAIAREFIRVLRSLGCRFSLDDFGTGAASFYYLKQLKVDYLKIDGSLIKSLLNVEGDGYFVRAIVEMCKGLGILTVAEYVENEALMTLVQKAGVDFAQGYFVGHPLSLAVQGLGNQPEGPTD